MHVGSIPGLEKSSREGSGNRLHILAWRIPWTEEPGGLQSMRPQRVGHDWSDLACIAWILVHQKLDYMWNWAIRGFRKQDWDEGEARETSKAQSSSGELILLCQSCTCSSLRVNASLNVGDWTAQFSHSSPGQAKKFLAKEWVGSEFTSQFAVLAGVCHLSA